MFVEDFSKGRGSPELGKIPYFLAAITPSYIPDPPTLLPLKPSAPQFTYFILALEQCDGLLERRPSSLLYLGNTV